MKIIAEPMIGLKVLEPQVFGDSRGYFMESYNQKTFQKLGIEDRSEHKPSELSGGEQQRVAVCRALINSPKIIFADEPSGNLDTKNARELHELFFDLLKEFGQTFVIVTHNEELAKMADRQLVMSDGKVVV